MEAGRRGNFVFSSANLQAAVAADVNQGFFVPQTGQNGSAGAWVRQFTGYVDPRWFNVVSTNTAAQNTAAWNAMMATLKACASVVGFYASLTGVQFQDEGPYNFNTIDLNAGTFRVTSVLLPTLTSGTVVQFTGQTAFRLQRGNTDGVAGVVGSGTGADQIIIEYLNIRGGYAPPTAEAEQHAIHARCHGFTIRRNVISGFAGDGVYIYAGADVTQGNANSFSVEDNIVFSCRNGIFIHGADTNAGATARNDLSNNRRWGLRDESFLGNSHLSNTIENCGITFNTVSTLVSYLGHRYAFREGGNSANAPSGTTADTADWYYVNDLGPDTAAYNIPTWTAPVVVRTGGCYSTTNNNANNVFFGGYTEPGQGPAQCVWPTLVVGGQQTAGVKGVAYIRHDDSGVRIAGQLSVDAQLTARTGEVYIGIAGAPTVDPLVTVSGLLSSNTYFRSFTGGFQRDGSYHSSRFYGASGGLKFYGKSILALGTGDVIGGTAVDVLSVLSTGTSVTGAGSYTGALTASNLSGTNTGDQFTSVAQNTIIGRVAAGSGPASALTVLPTAAMPALTGDISNTAGSLATTLGANVVTYTKFQQVAANSLVGNPTGSLANAQGITLAGGLAFSGTTLTAAGALTPTSVAATGAITSSGGGVGYATGAGGTIAQGTSRTTTVILNKLCGNVTLFSNTTAAGQFDKFTLTNSQIAANDVVNVCVKTATANYIVCVLSVAAGSCVIGVYTPAAVAVAEAPVLNFTVSKAVNA
jgi:hypothetical protein